MEIIKLIALLCQLHMDTTNVEVVQASQKACQKRLATCVVQIKSTYPGQPDENILFSCLKE